MKNPLLIALLIAVFGFGGCSKPNAVETHTMKRFQHSEFSLLAPDSWTDDQNPDVFSISAPHDIASVTATAYYKQKGDLDEFAAHRFSSILPFYSQVGAEARSISSPIERIVRHYEGTWPGDTLATYYIVACIHLPEVYVSLSITTTRQEFEANSQLYESIIQSVTNDK